MIIPELLQKNEDLYMKTFQLITQLKFLYVYFLISTPFLVLNLSF